MLETILYQLSKISGVLIIFLVVVMLVSFILYKMTKKFNIHKKSVMLCGMLTSLKNTQLIMITAIIIRTFLVMFTAIFYTKNILLYLKLFYPI